MSTIVLVPGAFHGAWCWDKLVPMLTEQGHETVAVDLPGHGADKTPPSDVTLQSYVDCVCDVLDALSEPALLVGHSMAGIVISEAAEQRTPRVRKLVYLCGYLLRNGETLFDAQADSDSLVPDSLILNEDEGWAAVKDEAVREVFYGDCSEEDIDRARQLLVADAIAPAVTPITISEENFGQLPRVYIETLQDRAVPPALQQRMYTALPCETVLSMNTSHAPFFSAPEELATHLEPL